LQGLNNGPDNINIDRCRLDDNDYQPCLNWCLDLPSNYWSADIRIGGIYS